MTRRAFVLSFTVFCSTFGTPAEAPGVLVSAFFATNAHDRNSAMRDGMDRARSNPTPKEKMLPADPFAFQI